MARGSYHDPEIDLKDNQTNNEAHQGRMGALNRYRHLKPVDETEGQTAIARTVMRADGARGYLRQIDAWTKVTRTPADQQALLLYQHLTGRAWIEAEELDVTQLASTCGVEVFKTWISERYQEIEVGKIAEALNGFFKKLRQGHHQTIREFNGAFDWAYARLLEETAKAWAYLSALALSNGEELSILASVGNEYVTAKLQRAAVLHENSLRRAWDRDRPRPFDRNYRGPPGARVQTAHNADAGEECDEDLDDGERSGDEEEVRLYEAYMTAKTQYKDVVRGRGVDQEAVRRTAEERLAHAKARSFYSVCKQKGHWHRDPECPGRPPPREKDSNVHTAHVTNDIFETSGEISERLLAITDCACTRSVMGTNWLQHYVDVMRGQDIEVPLVPETDSFRFGASRVYSSSYAAVVSIQIEGKWILLKAADIHGDLPLLVSRGVLADLGMIYDLKNHKADFTALNVQGMQLWTTPTGHPALSVHPGKGIPGNMRPKAWDVSRSLRGEVQIMAQSAYMAVRASVPGAQLAEDAVPATERLDYGHGLGGYQHILYAKKLSPEVRNLLIGEVFHVDSFLRWWEGTKINSDFWLETPSTLIRIHVVPRKAPLDWQTNQHVLRSDLLRALGSFRTTCAVSCKSLRELPVANDMWDKVTRRQKGTFVMQCLWVGRTVFNCRAPRACLLQPEAPGPGYGQSGAMADEQDGATRRDDSTWDEPKPVMDRDRAAQLDGRDEGGGQEDYIAKGAEPDEATGTSRGSGQDRSPLQHEDAKGSPPPADSGLPRHALGDGHDDRSASGQHLQPNTTVLRRVGLQGGPEQHASRSSEVRHVVPSSARSRTPPTRATNRPDAPPGEVREESPTAFGGRNHRDEPLVGRSSSLGSPPATDATVNTEHEAQGRQDHIETTGRNRSVDGPHGDGSRPEGPGRDSGAGGQASGIEGQGGLPRHQAVADNALPPAGGQDDEVPDGGESHTSRTSVHSEDANNRPELAEEEALFADEMLQQAAAQILPKLNGEPVLECATPTSGEFQSGNIEAGPATPGHVVDDHWEYNYQLGVLVRFHYHGRRHLYVPEDDFVQVCPVEIYQLQDTRMTVWHYTDPQHDGGVQRVHPDDWRSTGPAETGDELWQGMTVFRLEGFPGLDQGVLEHLQDGHEPEFPDNLGEDVAESDGLGSCKFNYLVFGDRLPYRQ